MMKNYFVISVLSLFSLSCNNEKKTAISPELDRQLDSLVNVGKLAAANAEIAEQNRLAQQPPITISKVNYSFVVIKMSPTYGNGGKTIASGIIETPVYLSEDERYKILDDAQTELTKLEIGNVVSRDLKIYESYAKASKERAKILDIDSRSQPEITDAAKSAAADAAKAAGDAAIDASRDAEEY